jgi:hypothetical protein
VSDDPEQASCQPVSVGPECFNAGALLPYGLTTEHIGLAMSGFVSFLGYMNVELRRNGIERLESMMMPANFSTLVSEFMSSNLPKHCAGLVKNQYHNGHPDLIPAATFPSNAVQYAHDGIELKGSRYLSGWQGHNPEDVWLMVFVYDSNRPRDIGTEVVPYPFRFLGVFGAELTKADWNFAGRSATSRRTITASINALGYRKMTDNWVYRVPGLNPRAAVSAPSSDSPTVDPPVLG